VGPGVRLDDVKTRKTSVAHARIQSPDRTARSLVRLPTTLSRLLGLDIVGKKSVTSTESQIPVSSS